MRLRALSLAALLGLGSGAAACPEVSEPLLFHSCHGPSRAEIVLLPEDPEPQADAPRFLAVTGTYTGRDSRGEGLPNPVGLFLRDGRAVNPTLARMDGILLIGPDRQPSIHVRDDVPVGGLRFDLRDPAARSAFIAEAGAARIDVLQSHLLIRDGRLDLRPVPDAPRYVRRIFFSGPHGYGVWQSPAPLTLYDAAAELARTHAPRMALNLDMGSFDYCWRAEAGPARGCGLRGRGETGALSNLLVLRQTAG
ncbi:MAG: hypothetical protein ACFBSD_16190 [Paracoccaceae bacterium]